MPFRRRSSSKPSSSRGWSKVRLTKRHDVADIESWVDFALRNGSYDEEQISLPSLRKKEESKETVYEALKSKCLLNLSNSSIE